jgi:hypothetical protein
MTVVHDMLLGVNAHFCLFYPMMNYSIGMQPTLLVPAKYHKDQSVPTSKPESSMEGAGTTLVHSTYSSVEWDFRSPGVLHLNSLAASDTANSRLALQLYLNETSRRF